MIITILSLFAIILNGIALGFCIRWLKQDVAEVRAHWLACSQGWRNMMVIHIGVDVAAILLFGYEVFSASKTLLQG